MVATIILVIGFIASIVLISFAIYVGWTLVTKYKLRSINNNRHKHNDDNISLQAYHQEIHCDDIKATTITISQHPQQPSSQELDQKIQHQLYQNNEPYHVRKRSQSDPDILLDSIVTLAIESPDQNSPNSIKTQPSVESTESDESVSPLSTPKSQSAKQEENKKSTTRIIRHQRSLPITDDVIQQTSSIIDDITTTTTGQDTQENDDAASIDISPNCTKSTKSTSLNGLIEDMTHIIDTINNEEIDDDDDEDEDILNAEELQQVHHRLFDSQNREIHVEFELSSEHKAESRSVSISGNKQRTEITRMIINDPDVRIIDDDTRSSVSIESTNLSYSTADSQYTGFMRPADVENKEKVEQKEINEISIESETITYHNSNEDYNILHGIQAVTAGRSPQDELDIGKPLSKLSENDERKEIDDDDGDDEDVLDVGYEKDDEIVGSIKSKISEYKASCKNKEENNSIGFKERRESVTALENNRVVKSKRLLFQRKEKIKNDIL